jgi:hypothetical protein
VQAPKKPTRMFMTGMVLGMKPLISAFYFHMHSFIISGGSHLVIGSNLWENSLSENKDDSLVISDKLFSMNSTVLERSEMWLDPIVKPHVPPISHIQG